MDLNREIEGLLGQNPAAQAAALMGYDGMAVAQASRGSLPCPLATWLTEYAQTLVVLRRAFAELPEGGRPTEVAIHTTQATVLLMAVDAAHYLAVVQPPHAPHGRARYFMQHLGVALAAEL